VTVEVRRIRAGEGERLRAIRLQALLDTPSAFAMPHQEEARLPAADWEAAAERRS